MSYISAEQLNEMVSSVGQKLISKKDLVARVFGLLGFEVAQELGSYWLSKPFATHKIEGDFLSALEKNNFTFEHRPDGVVTLCDRNPQNHVPGYCPSNYWNFWRKGEKKDGELELVLYLAVSGRIGQRERGVILTPHVAGPCLSPCDFQPQSRVFKVVDSFDHSANPIVKRIVEGDGQIIVGWQEIQLGGIRELAYLFGEFCSVNDEIKSLAMSHLSPFNPAPFSQSGRQSVYLPEPDQPMLFGIWSKQLEGFKAAL